MVMLVCEQKSLEVLSVNDSQSQERYIKGRVPLKRHQLKELVSESCTKGRYELIKKALRTKKTLFFHWLFI